MANEYASWEGVAEITDVKLFDKDKNELKPPPKGTVDPYEEIRSYLPNKPANAATHYFVAKVPTTSESNSTTDVLRLFVNESWDKDFRPALDALEFVKVKDAEHLIATTLLDFPPAGWIVEEKMELFANLVPGKGRMAKVVFTRNVPNGEVVTAFWCWP